MSHRGLFNTNHRLSLAARDSPGQLRDTHGSYTDSPHTDTRRLARRLGRHLADTWQTLGRHAQTRGTLRPAWHWQTRRRLEAHHERHFGSTHLASGKRQARGETRSHAQRAQTRGTPRETSRVHTLGRADRRETTRDTSSAHLEALTDAETGLALADKAQTRGTPGRQGAD